MEVKGLYIIFAWAMTPIAALAATRTSANYSMQAETLDAGGRFAASSNYGWSQGSIESGTIDTSDVASISLQHGFVTFFDTNSDIRLKYQNPAGSEPAVEDLEIFKGMIKVELNDEEKQKLTDGDIDSGKNVGSSDVFEMVIHLNDPEDYSLFKINALQVALQTDCILNTQPILVYQDAQTETEMSVPLVIQTLGDSYTTTLTAEWDSPILASVSSTLRIVGVDYSVCGNDVVVTEIMLQVERFQALEGTIVLAALAQVDNASSVQFLSNPSVLAATDDFSSALGATAVISNISDTHAVPIPSWMDVNEFKFSIENFTHLQMNGSLLEQLNGESLVEGGCYLDTPTYFQMRMNNHGSEENRGMMLITIRTDIGGFQWSDAQTNQWFGSAVEQTNLSNGYSGFGLAADRKEYSPLRIKAPYMDPNGECILEITGHPHAFHVLQSSHDFKNWISLGNILLDEDGLADINLGPITEEQQFFRLDKAESSHQHR